MPVIPDFQPVSAPGSVLQNSQSLMQRAQANRRAEEAAEMDRQKFEIMRPVLESQARVQLVSEANDLTSAHIINNSIAGDLQRFPDYVKAWTDSAQIEDPKERLTERRRILGAITPFSAIKSAAPTVKAFQEQYAQDAMADKTADMLAGRVEVAGAQNETRLAKATADNEAKIKIAEANFAARESALKMQMEKFQQQQAHAAEMAQMKDETARRGQDLVAKTKADSAAAMKNRPREQAALKFNEGVVAKVDQSTEELPKFMRALDILESPEVRTGTAAGVETAARRMGEIFGFDVGKVRNLEELQSTLGSSFLAQVGRMKGAVSDKETKELISMSPGIGKSAAGNIALVNNIVQLLSRNVAMAQLVNEARQEGATEAEIQANVLQTSIDTPIGAFMPARESAAVAAPAGGLSPQEQTRLQELRAKLGR